MMRNADPPPRKIPLIFFQTTGGAVPVRDWLRTLPELDRRAIGLDLMRVQFRWPVGMPLCRPLGHGLWEVRTSLRSARIARVIICFAGGELIALNIFIKKTQKTPLQDIEISLKRKKDYQS